MVLAPHRSAFLTSVIVGLVFGLFQQVSAGPIEEWEQHMVTAGRTLGDTLTFGPPADMYQYDAARVYYQIADYTHEQSWSR